MLLAKLHSSILLCPLKSSWRPILQSIRHAHVVGTPPSLFFTRSEQDRIRHIAKQANKFKIDYELKYAEKIRLKAQRRGVSVQQLKQQAKKSVPVKPASSNGKQHPVMPSSASPVSAATIKASPSTSTIPKLDDIVKLDLLERESADRITQLWHEYHSTKENTINAVIPAEIYQNIRQRGERYPMFIFPLPRNNGLEFYLLQVHDRQCYFTSLAEYKLKQDQARPFLSLTHYDELQDTKHIVLMHGHIYQPNIVNTQDAQFLAFCVQQFYGGLKNQKDDPLFRLVKQFHEHPESFDYLVLIAAMDRLTSY